MSTKPNVARLRQLHNELCATLRDVQTNPRCTDARRRFGQAQQAWDAALRHPYFFRSPHLQNAQLRQLKVI